MPNKPLIAKRIVYIICSLIISSLLLAADCESDSSSGPTEDAPPPTSAPVPTPTTDVPLSVRSGEVHRDHWYGAAEICVASEMAQWSNAIWQDTAVTYLGATIVLGAARTDWSLSPEDLRDYREFLDGTRTFATSEWSSMFETYKRFNDTLASAIMVRSSGAVMISDFLRPDFPHAWLATYHSVLPRLQEMSNSDGRLTGTIRIPQGRDDNPVRDSLGLFKNQFYCRTAELQG